MSRLSPHLPILSCLVVLCSLIAPAAARAQGVLINVNPSEQVILPRPIIVYPPYYPHPRPQPIPDSTYKIKALEVNVKLQEQVARVQVSQSFVNTGSRPMEVCFVFPLPYDGAVDQLTLLIDGKEYPAKLMPASEARHLYEEIVRKNRDPALLEWMGTGLFKTSVFPVPPGAERKVTLRYSQLCRKTDGLTDFLFPLSTAKYTSQPVESIKFQVAIDSQTEIKNVYSPSHAIEIKRPDDKHAVVSYKAENNIPAGDFRLFYDVGRGQVGATVLSYRHNDNEDGYFLLLASPAIKAAGDERPKKTVVFVVDRSGSMSGEKIEQAKGAAKFVLNNLHDGDLFNVIAFDSEVESWKPELQKLNDETRKAALGFIEGIYAGGSTNIDGALRAALTPLHDASRQSLVLFLTDGLPTDGEQNEAKIIENAKQYNKAHARIFTFGVGYDLNSRLLDKLARENSGDSEYVRPNENIESRVSALYNRISAPVLSDLSIKWDIEGSTSERGKPVNRVYPKDSHDLFAGEQLVIVGRYKHFGNAKVVVTGRVGDKEEKFDFPATLVEKSNDESTAFIEKLWAVRRIGEILDELDLKGRNEELVKELIALSRHHGVLTPYTSFMADENGANRDVTTTFQEVDRRLDLLKEVEGQIGVEQREAKEQLLKANSPADGTYAGSADLSTIGGRASGAQSAGRGFYFRDSGLKPGEGAPLARATVAQPLGDKLSAAATEPADSEGAKVVQNVRSVGRKVFYRRGDQWIDSTVTADQEKQPIKIERYSKEYFELIDKFGRDVAKYMAFDEPVVIELDGKAYSF
jgi:Ca-activated chloride channel homolog